MRTFLVSSFWQLDLDVLDEDFDVMHCCAALEESLEDNFGMVGYRPSGALLVIAVEIENEDQSAAEVEAGEIVATALATHFVPIAISFKGRCTYDVTNSNQDVYCQVANGVVPALRNVSI